MKCGDTIFMPKSFDELRVKDGLSLRFLSLLVGKECLYFVGGCLGESGVAEDHSDYSVFSL